MVRKVDILHCAHNAAVGPQSASTRWLSASSGFGEKVSALLRQLARHQFCSAVVFKLCRHWYHNCKRA